MFISIKKYFHSNRWFYLSFRKMRNRWQIWRYGLKDVHSTFYVSSGCKISPDLIAKEYGFIADGCRIGAKVELGKYVMFGPDVAIVGADHVYDLPGVPIIFSGRPEVKVTVIEDDVWVGYGTVIMAGVCIGRGSIVAAGSIVTKDIPPYGIFGGVPAKKIRDRFMNEDEIAKHELMLSLPAQEGAYCKSR